MSPHINMLVSFNKKGNKRGGKVEEHLTNMRKMSPENFQPHNIKPQTKKKKPPQMFMSSWLYVGSPLWFRPNWNKPLDGICLTKVGHTI